MSCWLGKQGQEDWAILFLQEARDGEYWGHEWASTYLGALRAGLDAGPQLGKKEKGRLSLSDSSSQHTYSVKSYRAAALLRDVL